MNFQFTHPYYLLLLPVALAWVIWLAWKSDVQISRWRRWLAFSLRTLIVTGAGAGAGRFAMAPAAGRHECLLPAGPLRQHSLAAAGAGAGLRQQERQAKKNRWTRRGVIVFGSEASIETTANAAVDVEKIQAVVGTERTDIAGAIRLGTAAFPETGQKRLVLMSDGNENIGDAMTAVLAARPLGRDAGCRADGHDARERRLGAKIDRAVQAEKRAGLRGQNIYPVGPGHAGHVAAVSQRTISGRAKGGTVRGQEPVHLSADPVGTRIITITTCGWKRRATPCRRTTGPARLPA